MDSHFVEGERIVIKLNNGENFEGDFVRGNKEHVQVDNIFHHESGIKQDCLRCFYRKEIDRIYKLGDDTPKNVENHMLVNSTSVLMHRDEYERLKSLANEFQLIKCNDHTYHESVNKILDFESIGLYAIGAEKGRLGRIKILAVSTWKKVYIFDLMGFRCKFPAELQHLLESQYITKIVHNGGPLQDCLQNLYKIFMKNVFDTQVAHFTLTKSKYPSNLVDIGQCLTEYYNFPPTLLKSSLESLTESWDARPLDEFKLKKLARLVIYLITVKDYQMGKMMQNFYQGVEDYHNLYTTCSDYKALTKCSTPLSEDEIEKVVTVFKNKLSC